MRLGCSNGFRCQTNDGRKMLLYLFLLQTVILWRLKLKVGWLNQMYKSLVLISRSNKSFTFQELHISRQNSWHNTFFTGKYCYSYYKTASAEQLSAIQTLETLGKYFFRYFSKGSMIVQLIKRNLVQFTKRCLMGSKWVLRWCTHC